MQHGGEEGLRIFGAHAAEVDLLLTDVAMPGKIREREIAEQIMAMRPRGVGRLYVRLHRERIVHQGRVDDGVHLLGKPFKRDQLARKMTEVLGEARTALTTSANSGTNVVEIKADHEV